VKSTTHKPKYESEYISSNNSIIKKNNEKLRKVDIQLINKDYISEELTPKNTQSIYKQRDFAAKNKNKNKNTKLDFYEGSISENEKELRSNNFLYLKHTLSPMKKDFNRSQSPHCDNEYIKLENQIKEMQNQINSMNTDFTINRCFSSKSFGLFTAKNTLEKTNIYNNNYMNPFIENLNKNEKNISAATNAAAPYKINYYEEVNKHSENLYKDKENTINPLNHIMITNNTNVNNDYKKQGMETTIQDSSNKKELNTISYVTPQNMNLNEVRRISVNNIAKEAAAELDYKTKIESIEGKLGKMENDISEMKGNFTKLYDAIFKLIDLANSKNTSNNIYPLNNPSSGVLNKNENFHNLNDPSNYGQRDHFNYNHNNNINDHNNSQRINTQASKISSNQLNHIQNAIPPQNNFVISTNSVTNSNNDALNLILAECNKLKNQNRDYQNENNVNNNYLNSNYNPNYNTHNNMNNYNYDNQDLNYFESPRNYRNEILLNSNVLNMPYTENPSKKSLAANNYKRNNKIIDGSFNHEEDYSSNNNTNNNQVNFEESKSIFFLI